MKTVQMTIDEDLLAEVDRLTKIPNTTRSAFVRDALQVALRCHVVAQLEQRHARGYANDPIMPGEFDLWETEQHWGEQ